METDAPAFTGRLVVKTAVPPFMHAVTITVPHNAWVGARTTRVAWDQYLGLSATELVAAAEGDA